MITIFVAKLDFGVTENDLLSLFQQYGTVAKVTVAKDKETNKPRGFAFVEMPNAEQAKQAIEALDGHVFNGRSCVIKEAEGKPNAPANRGNREQNGDRRFQKNPNDRGNFKPRTENNDRPRRESSDFKKPAISNESDLDKFPMRSEDDKESSSDFPSKFAAPKKKVEKPKTSVDNTADGKNKKQKMNAYKKSGKDSVQFDDEDSDEDFDLFGRNDDSEDEDDYRKYLVNQSDEDEDEWDDEDEDWDDEDEDDEWEDR